MQTKKTTMLAAGLVVAIVALAGVGYALSYTAITTNTNNTMKPVFIEMTQSGADQYDADAFLEDLYFNTVDDEGELTYAPVLTHVYTESAGNSIFTEATEQAPANHINVDYALLGKGITLSVNFVNVVAGTTLSLAIQAENFNSVAGLSYFFGIGTESQGVITIATAQSASIATANQNTWTITGLTVPEADQQGNQTATWNLFLFVKTTSGPIDEGSVGFDFSQDKTVNFTFTLTATTPVASP